MWPVYRVVVPVPAGVTLHEDTKHFVLRCTGCRARDVFPADVALIVLVNALGYHETCAKPDLPRRPETA